MHRVAADHLPSCQRCTTGFKDCDGNAANGCETPLNAVGSCGDCGVVCPARDNATPTCVGSACGFTCTPGAATGFGWHAVRVRVALAPALHGRALPGRANEACLPLCYARAAGFGNCDGNAGNGCETPLNTVSNCGGCGTTCPGGPGAAPTCTGTPPVCGLICAPGEQLRRDVVGRCWCCWLGWAVKAPWGTRTLGCTEQAKSPHMNIRMSRTAARLHGMHPACVRLLPAPWPCRRIWQLRWQRRQRLRDPTQHPSQLRRLHNSLPQRLQLLSNLHRHSAHVWHHLRTR